MDILVIQEPGKIEGKECMIKLATLGHECRAEVAIFPGKGSSGGCVIIMSPAWAAVATDRFVEGSEGRCAFMEFVAAERVDGEPMHRLLLAAVYGYNDGALPQHRSHALKDCCSSRISKYRKRYKHASAILIGDLNAAQESALDTDRGTRGREPDAAVIDGFMGIGLDDVFRQHYPTTCAITHKATGGNGETAGRRLDYILATKDIVDHDDARVGIYCPRMSTDHRMVIMDSALNCADAAGRHIPTWPQRKVQWFVNVHEPSKEQIGEFNSALANSMGDVVSCRHREQQGQQLIAAFKAAAEGTVAMTKWEKCPKPVNKLKHYTTQDYKLRQWRRKLVAAEIALARGKYEHKLIEAVPWKLDAGAFEGLEVDKLQDVLWCIEQGHAGEGRKWLTNQI